MIRRPPRSTLFPYTRSSDLSGEQAHRRSGSSAAALCSPDRRRARLYRHRFATAVVYEDRKSTRLNSSHVKISYAVFCLKKKKNKMNTIQKKLIKQTKPCTMI